MAHRSAPCGRDPVRNTLLDSSTHKHQLSSKLRRSSTPKTTSSGSVAFGRTHAHRIKEGDARSNSRGSCISRGNITTRPASTLTCSRRAQRRASMGMSAGAAVGTALSSQGETSELTALQQEDWPGFVAFFRGASSYVQVSKSHTTRSPVPSIRHKEGDANIKSTALWYLHTVSSVCHVFSVVLRQLDFESGSTTIIQSQGLIL